MKTTPAMKDWCYQLSTGMELTRRPKAYTGPYFATRVYGAVGAPTYVMANKLEDAGLIVWKPCLRWERPHERAELTELGAEAARPKKGLVK